MVGLEIKREFTVGHLSGWRSAALPVAGAIGGMVAPAALYLLVVPPGPWTHGWGVPMSTDTAFAVALIVMLGSRVPVELRIFLTAAAIVDDLCAIAAVAVFYSGELHLVYLPAALAGRRARDAQPLARLYARALCRRRRRSLGVRAGERPASDPGRRHPRAVHSDPAAAEPDRADDPGKRHHRRRGGGRRRGAAARAVAPALRALDAIHDRLELPADRLLRHAGARSSYLVLPLFALANAGVAIRLDTFVGRERLFAAIIAGLVIGKPLGIVAASALAVALRPAIKPKEYSWPQLAAAGALAGIGFTMSLFIAGEAFRSEADFEAAKIAVFIASILSAVAGVTLLTLASPKAPP